MTNDPLVQFRLLHHLNVPPGHLHALGAISVNFNLLESSFYFLLELFAPKSTVDYFFWELNNEERVRMLKHFSQVNADPAITERIEAACDYFRACFQNRNLLMHSRVGRATSSEALSLASTRRQGELQFDVPLATLQRVADEAWVGVEFCLALADYIESFRGALSELLDQKLGAGPRLANVARSLPTIPAPPLRINPNQPIFSIKKDA